MIPRAIQTSAKMGHIDAIILVECDQMIFVVLGHTSQESHELTSFCVLFENPKCAAREQRRNNP
jgi:hypothetical protein